MTKLRNLLLSGMILILSAGLFDASAADFNPIKFEKETLENGLQVIYCVDRSAPVVSTFIHYQVGSRDEDSSQTGYAHFFEHLMFEATEDIPRESIDVFVQEAGGQLNAATSFDQTIFFFKTPSNQIKLPLWIESQRMRKLLVEEVGVETQRGVVLEEIKQRSLNSPYGSLLYELCENLFPGGLYSWPVLGYSRHIERATIQNFKDFYNNFYQPNNATLVVCGDFNVGEVKQYVRDYFGVYPKAAEPVRNRLPVKPLEKGITKTIPDAKAQLPAIFIGYRGPKLTEDDYYASTFLVDILASGESSRLYRRLVDKDQIAVQSSVVNLSLEYGGILAPLAIVSPGSDINEVEEAIMEEINDVIENGFTDEEFEKAKNIKEAQFVAGKKNVMDKARALARYNSYFGDPSMINTEIDKYMSVTKEDVMRVAKKYFGTDKKIVLKYMPVKQ